MVTIKTIKQLPAEISVTFRGIVKAVRDLKKHVFLVIEQEGFSVQVVCEKEGDQVWIFSRYQHVEVSGKTKMPPKGGVIEIHATAAHVLGECMSSALLDEKAGLEAQLDERHISLRFETSQTILRLSSLFEYAMRRYWFENNYTEIHTPKIVEGATESGAEVFKLDYFGKNASLAQSPQFFKQLALIGGFDRVFEIGSVFRAEPSFTSKHATDFTMVDVELGVSSVTDVMDEEEALLRYAFGFMARSGKVTASLEKRFQDLVLAQPFLRITHAEVVKVLAKEYQHILPPDADLDSQAEKLLCEWALKNGLSEFVFVTNYPAKVRPFYTMVSEDGFASESFDLLWAGVEITSGAQREHRHSHLLANLARKGVGPESIASYLKFFEASVPPHGGFGLGLARVMAILCELDSIRLSSFVFRGPNRLVP